MPNESDEPSESSASDAVTVAADAVNLDYASRSPAPIVNAPAGRLDWAAIAVRLAALWCLFEAIPGILFLPFLSHDHRQFGADAMLLKLLQSCAYAIAGVILWLTAAPLARANAG